MADLVFDLSPTQSAFVNSEAHICQLKGPMGEGKTFAGCGGVIRHAERCRKEIRGALIRDTHQNIKTSTVPDIKEVLGPWVSFHDDEKKMRIHCDPPVSMDLFGIDDPASLSKLQGPQYSVIWLEEPAPIQEKANAGLPKGVFDLAIARAARQRGTLMRVQVTQNPADEDHWTEELSNAPRIYFFDEETGVSIIKETFDIKYGENVYANPHMRAANKAAFKDDPGKFARYVLGLAAAVMQGKAVTPSYNPQIHYSKIELPVIPGALGVRFWDSWHHPACVIGQYIRPGRLIFHHVCCEENIGPQELATQFVIPLLKMPKYAGKIPEWRDIGDPTMTTPDQSSRSRSAAKVVEQLLKNIPAGFQPRFEKGPVSTQGRIRPTNTALGTNAADGSGPIILISKTAFLLHRCFSGGWHWKTDNSGKIVGVKPVKDRMGDIGDAASYGIATIFPYERPQVPYHQRKKTKIRNQQIALSYGPRNAGAGIAGDLAGGFPHVR